MKPNELAAALRRTRQALWVVRAASCGADTCPAPDAVTALAMIHTAVNGILGAERELREDDGSSITPVPVKGPPLEGRNGVEVLARKTILELEELHRNVTTMTRDMAHALEADDIRRLESAGVILERAISTLRVTIEGALLGVPPSEPNPRT